MDTQVQQEMETIVDELGPEEDKVVPVKYCISSYGADYDVDGLVRRVQRDDIYIPPFQREFIWTLRQSSRFIESLLLGLPVPGIFLSRDEDNRLSVIDGQQRLRTLQYFYEGIFAKSGKEFALYGVQDLFLGQTYKTLVPEDRRQLDNSIIHVTIIRQDEPSDDNTSVYYIFERLNTTGTPLTQQEIRATIYRGGLNYLFEKLNLHPAWRSVYGRISKRRRDQEFILRFFALYFDSEKYSSPMKEFLNKYMIGNRHLQRQSEEELTHLFTSTIGVIHEYLGKKAFRPYKGFNAAVFDAVMVAVARRLRTGNIEDEEGFKTKYQSLLENVEFLEAIETGTTAGLSSMSNRIDIATNIFQDVG